MKFIDSVLGSMKENRFLALLFGSIMVGVLDGLIIPLLIKLFSGDQLFALWELIITFLIMIIILFGFIRYCLKVIKFKFLLFLIIPGILTIIFPLGGGLFGGTGNEPIWQFILLGLIGSLFWSIPLFLWLLIAKLTKKTQ